MTDRNACTCGPWHPSMDGPSETCPEHGRSYSEWVERGDTLAARLEAANAECARLSQANQRMRDALAEAWSEGNRAGWAGAVGAGPESPPNPYRKGD